MVYCFDGQYLSSAEEELVDVAIQNLDGFVARSSIHRCVYLVQSVGQLTTLHNYRAMIFPAIDSRRRYLLHKTVEMYYPQLCTFSVGEDDNRRLIIAFVKRLEKYGNIALIPKCPESLQQCLTGETTSQVAQVAQFVGISRTTAGKKGTH